MLARFTRSGFQSHLPLKNPRSANGSPAPLRLARLPPPALPALGYIRVVSMAGQRQSWFVRTASQSPAQVGINRITRSVSALTAGPTPASVASPRLASPRVVRRPVGSVTARPAILSIFSARRRSQSLHTPGHLMSLSAFPLPPSISRTSLSK